MQTCRLLLVEDNADDVFMFTRAASSFATNLTVSVAADPEEAFGIAQAAAKAGEPLTLVVTDLKMPKATGIQLIERMRMEAEFQSLPILLLSSSDQPRDVRDAYQAGANAYLVKPSGLGPYKNLLGQILSFLEKRQVPGGASFFRTLPQ